MFCGNCGKQIPEGAKFCPICGYMQDEVYPDNRLPEKKKKGRWKQILLVIFLMVVCIVFVLFFIHRKRVQKIEEQLNLGNRYLQDLDYEEAAIAFDKVIGLDPRNMDAYISLCRSYLGMAEDVMQGRNVAIPETEESAWFSLWKEKLDLDKNTDENEEQTVLNDKAYKAEIIYRNVLMICRIIEEIEPGNQEAEEIRNQAEDALHKFHIPNQAAEFRGHYYCLFDDISVSTYEEALEFCTARGGYLAVLTTEEENSFVFSYMVQQGYKSAYFGLSDAADEGKWIWCNGETVSYTNWHSGEPNNENAAEHYAMFYYKYPDGTWNDGDFGNMTVNDGKAFICEWGAY